MKKLDNIFSQPILPKATDIWGARHIKGVDFYETEGKGGNEGRVLNIATVVLGRQIFWKAYKEHYNNKDYYWKTFLGNTLNM